MAVIESDFYPVREVFNYYPLLEIKIGDRWARLGFDNKRTLLRDYGILFLGIDFVDDAKYIFKLPKDPVPEMEGLELRGFTSDPEVIRIYKAWLESYGEKVDRV